MLMSSVFTGLYAVLCIFCINYIIKKNKSKINIIIPCIIIAFLLRIFLAYTNMGHATDRGCFSSWASMLAKDGLTAFYSSDAFTDYPPGYMYILRYIGMIKNAFTVTLGIENIILRLPAIVCDIITGDIIYFIAKCNLSKTDSGIIGAFYLFNPAVIINSSVWGQVDSVYLVFILAGLYFLMQKKYYFFLFALAVLFKPQALILTPVYLFAIYEYIKDNGAKSVFKLIPHTLLAVLVLVAPMLPFDLNNVINQYISTLSSYKYATVNAFNLWGALGMNWNELTITVSVIGYVFIAVTCVISGFIYFKTKTSSKYFITGSFLYFATYMLSAKMHERYAFCAIALALLAFILSDKRKNFLLFLFITISQVINTAWILFVYETNPTKYYQSFFIIFASVLNLILLAYMTIYCVTDKSSNLFIPKQLNGFEPSQKSVKITRTDILAITCVTILYSVVALAGLGSHTAPQTDFLLKENYEISFDNTKNISEIAIFNGNIPIDEKNVVTIEFSDENNNILQTHKIEKCSVFKWEFITIDHINAKYAVIYSDHETPIKELAFFDNTKSLIIPIETSTLFDEQDTVPMRSSSFNSTYFDEIYHARTAYEFIHGLDVYEWTHPPLGKIFISLGIRLFGMTPFGWRIAGVMFGILMLPFMYLFAKKITLRTDISFVTCVIFAFDFMHFTQTRIATIDVYITFFVLLMYFFMYSYYKVSFYDTTIKKTFVPLLLCGVSFGLGVACKWTGIYAGAGLCVIFFLTLIKRYREFLFAKENPDFENSTYICSVFLKNTFKTLLFCILSFIIIPVIIYVLSYIPYLMSEGGGLGEIIKNQRDMFIYHSKTVLSSTHPYSSMWYEWIIMKRPIWYYSGEISESLKEGISAFGNPLVWYPSIATLIFMLFRSVIKKDKIAIFISIGYLAQLIPWVFVDRVVFIYHYFPSTVFMVLSIGYTLHILTSRFKKLKLLPYLYAVFVVLMFVAFYPVLSGMAVNPRYVYNYLKWFESWVLI